MLGNGVTSGDFSRCNSDMFLFLQEECSQSQATPLTRSDGSHPSSRASRKDGTRASSRSSRQVPRSPALRARFRSQAVCSHAILLLSPLLSVAHSRCSPIEGLSKLKLRSCVHNSHARRQWSSSRTVQYWYALRRLINPIC